MSAHFTTPDVTTNVTFDPYSSPCQRVLIVLRAWATPGETIEIVNRDLAAVAECSAGSIPRILRTLEKDGWIERVTSRQGSLIQLLDQQLIAKSRRSTVDRLPERSTVDRENLADSAPTSDLTPSDPIEKRIAELARSETDPPHTPRMEIHDHDSMQQQLQTRDQQPNIAEQDADLRAVLMCELEIVPRLISAILRARPTLGIDEIRTKGQNAQTRPDIDAPRLLAHCLLHNEPLYSLEESNARRQTIRAASASGVAAHRSKRPATPVRSTTNTDYDALLAQVRAANPHLQL